MVVSYGKKPRKSKTSEVYEIEGLSFFLYNAKSTTLGLCEVYFNDGVHYPLINVLESNEKAKLWIDANIVQIKLKMLSMASMEFITRDEFTKSIVKTKQKENINYEYPTIEELQLMHNKIIMETKNELDI